MLLFAIRYLHLAMLTGCNNNKKSAHNNCIGMLLMGIILTVKNKIN
jgi:hypothetical protein